MESEGCEEAYTPIEESEPPGPKKKRKTEVFQQLPSTSTVGFSPETVEELQAAYELVYSILFLELYQSQKQDRLLCYLVSCLIISLKYCNFYN